MILGDLTEEQLRTLNDTEGRHGDEQRAGEVTLRDDKGYYYWLTYRHRKYFHIVKSAGTTYFRKAGSGYERNRGVSIKLYDSLGFFQRSFVGALGEYFRPDERDSLLPDLPTIAAMKDERGKEGWAEQSSEDVRRYCVLECRYLVILLDRLREYLRACELYISDWDGTGAIARYLLKKYGVRQYMKPTPEEMLPIIERTYSGGRIESTAVGHEVGKFYDYDINSAYPAIMETLPCLACAHWERRDDPSQSPKSPWYVSRVKAKFASLRRANDYAWFPLWSRTVQGEIRYGPWSHGHYWGAEVESSREFFDRRPIKSKGDCFEIVEAWDLIVPCDHRPFAFIRQLYDLRLEMLASGNPAQYALKLAINSCYGKLIQQIGGVKADPAKNVPQKMPPFFQLEWGGLITAGTRAKLVRAALTLPRDSDVVFFATDGLLTKAPLQVPLPKEKLLGAWGLKAVYSEAIIALAGMYFLRSEVDGGWYVASRGLERKYIKDPLTIVQKWRAGDLTFSHEVTRFVSLRVALHSGEFPGLWRRWITIEREFTLDGASAKRLPYKGDPRLLAVKLSPLSFREGGDFRIGSYPYSIHFWKYEPYPGKQSLLASAFEAEDEEDLLSETL